MAPQEFRAFVIAVSSPWLRRAHCPQDREDIIAAGLLGIAKARARFDAARGYTFATYATWRIRSEVQDHLRYLDLGRRGARQREESVPQQVSSECLAQVPVHGQAETRHLLNELLSCLPARERFIIEQRHLLGRELNDISHEIGLCPSRVSQLCSHGMNKMRSFGTTREISNV